MENKETIVRETRYMYDENEKLTSMTVNETITNPCLCGEAQPVTGEVEYFDEEPSLAYAVLALASFCLGVTALVVSLKRR